MNKARITIALTVLLSLMCVICSCQTPGGRTAGRVIDDAAITTKVKAILIRDDILRGFSISVKTFEGEVTLSGAVDTKENRKRAEKLTRSVSGVLKVNNLIKLKE